MYFAYFRLPGGNAESTIAMDGRLNVLLLGTDPSGLNSDSMMFASLDLKGKQLDIMSIPRDTRVKIPGYGYQKINAAHLIGQEELSMEMVENLLGVDIDYYIAVNTKIFREIIDELGGVYFTVPQDMDYDDPVQNLHIHLEEGYQLLDGDKSEQLVRFRQYVEGDLQRTAVQRDFVKALLSQKLKLTYLNKLDDIYQMVSDEMKTNAKISDLTPYIRVLKGLDTTSVNMHMMPNIPQNIDGISYVLPDTDELNQLLVDRFGCEIPGYIKTPEEVATEKTAQEKE